MHIYFLLISNKTLPTKIAYLVSLFNKPTAFFCSNKRGIQKHINDGVLSNILAIISEFRKWKNTYCMYLS